MQGPPGRRFLVTLQRAITTITNRSSPEAKKQRALASFSWGRRAARVLCAPLPRCAAPNQWSIASGSSRASRFLADAGPCRTSVLVGTCLQRVQVCRRSLTSEVRVETGTHVGMELNGGNWAVIPLTSLNFRRSSGHWTTARLGTAIAFLLGPAARAFRCPRVLPAIARYCSTTPEPEGRWMCGVGRTQRPLDTRGLG